LRGRLTKKNERLKTASDAGMGKDDGDCGKQFKRNDLAATRIFAFFKFTG